MPTNVSVPPLGEGLNEVTIDEWLKRPGDQVTKGEPLVEISTSKATMCLYVPVDGYLAAVVAEIGETVEVGALVAVIDT